LLPNEPPAEYCSNDLPRRLIGEERDADWRHRSVLFVAAGEIEAYGWAGPPQHLHWEHDETFFVLTGAVRFTSGTDSLVASPGQIVTAPIGDAHAFANADDQAPASLLCTLTPQRYIDYFRELSQLTPGPDGRLDPAQVLAAMARYATEPYRPQP
jgi:mannose-6-phosphate isomerase-like protein (cupin superfamily)